MTRIDNYSKKTVWLRGHMFLLWIPIGIPILFFLLGILRTWQTQHSKNQKRFLSGTVAEPDGMFKGVLRGYTGPWRGKRFLKKEKTGMNVFSVGSHKIELYPFEIRIDKGYIDKEIQTIKLDYNLPKNPWWLRLILDEIVTIEKDAYIGKVHFRIIPGFSFALGYFELKKEA